MAHEVAALLLTHEGPGLIPDPAVTDEMMEAVEVYVNHITFLREQGPSFESVEQKLDLSEYHPELFGTADYVAYFSQTKTLHVVDYKHGRGIPVDVIGNSQLRYYGLGALHMNKFPVEKVILTIVQPRCYHPDGPVRSWETDSFEMLEFAADLIEDAIRTEDPNAPLVAGDHCRFCPAQPTCPKPREQAMALATSGFTDLTVIPAEKIALYLSKIPEIKAWCEAIHQYAHQQAALGNVPPGWKLVDKRANRRWIENLDEQEMEKVLGLDVAYMYDTKLKSPAAIEKLLRGKNQKELLNTFIVKESSGKTLVPVNDDRPPVKGAIENMFTTE